MVNTTLLRLFVLAVILVISGQIYLIIRYVLWPRIQRVTHCSWCWQDAGIMHEYPAPWSSTICHYHDHQMRAQSRRRRHTRLAPATTKPAVEVVQPHVEEEVLV